MSITHELVADGTPLVGANDWNEEHVVDLAFATVRLTSGNYTGTASATWGDVTGATATISTGARRVRVTCSGTVQLNTAGDSVGLDIAIDGTRVGATNGFIALREPVASYRMNLSFSFLTDVLSAGSHTIKLQSNRIGGSSTVTIFASSSENPLVWTVEETLFTT